MNWDLAIEKLSAFWNQPIPIIGFTIGTLIIWSLVIFSKTSIGKKALNKIKSINDNLTRKYNQAIDEVNYVNNNARKIADQSRKQLEQFQNYANQIEQSKDQEIEQLKNEYELKLTVYKSQLLKQDEMIKVICENSINKNIKEAYKKYVQPLEDVVYGEKEETINN